MKKQISLIAFGWLLFAAAFLSGCLKDIITRTYTYTMYTPVYKTMAAVRAEMKSQPAKTVQRPGKLFIKDQYLFLNEVDKGIHVINNSNPAKPKNIAFIPIPGNVDLAVKGNTLYADLYGDLITLDITNPQAVTLTTVLKNVFPHRDYYSTDSSMVIVDWIKKDTTMTGEYQVGCWYGRADSNNSYMLQASNSAPTPGAASGKSGQPGMGGSMARFTIVDERLYTVGMQELKVFDITHTKTPSFVAEKQIGFGIETIYPFKDELFIGSSTGMFVYSISNPDQPVQLGQFMHVRSCDPVIADDKNAYVTLRSGNFCDGSVNLLEVLNISVLSQPVSIKTYNLTNPHGLSKDGSLLFICDGADGLKVYDASKPADLKLLQTINGIETYDVIAYNNLALVVAKDGLYQFDYSDRNHIRQLSKLTITR